MYIDNNNMEVTEISPTLTTRVFNARARGRCVILMIGGDFGKGKTTCAMQLAYDIIHRFHPEKTDDELKQLVLKALVFTKKEFKDALIKESMDVEWEKLSNYEALKKGKEIRKDVVIWDDASIHGSKHKRSEAVAGEIQSKFHQIRDATCCMIITLPESDDLLKTIREYRGMLLGEIDTQKNQQYNKIIIYRRRVRAGRKSPWKGFIYSHMFPVRVDDEWYGAYFKLRNIAKKTNEKEEELKEEARKVELEYQTKRKIMLIKKMESMGASNVES